MVAAVAGVHRAFAVAEAGEERAAGFFAEDVAVGQAELADGALDQRGEALRDRAEELAAGLDQFVGGVGVGERAALGAGGERREREASSKSEAERRGA